MTRKQLAWVIDPRNMELIAWENVCESQTTQIIVRNQSQLFSHKNYTGWPPPQKKKKKHGTVDLLGLCSNQQ